MITEKLITLVEDRIKLKFPANVAPLDKAYPTSGETFIRVSGENTRIDLDESYVIVDATLDITCSSRIRKYGREHERIPYMTVIDYSERIYFWLLTYNNIRGDLLELFPQTSVTGRLECKYLRTKPEEVSAVYYDATENADRFPAGFKLTQSLLLPRLRIPLDCGQLPDYLMEMI